MKFLPRGLVPLVEDLLGSVPVVVLEGPRASGKTAIGSVLLAGGTLAEAVDLSDSTLRAAAAASPTAFVNGLRCPALVDEAQLVPELALAVKRRVDRMGGKPGAFLLTGSSRLGRAQLGGSDPLAGRSVRVRLWPMTQGELAGAPVGLVEALAARRPPRVPSRAETSRDDLLARIRRGGLPLLAGVASPVEAALRGQLAAEYVEGVLFHEVSGRVDRAELLRLFRFLAARTASLANVSAIGSELGATRVTVSARLAALEASFLVHALAGHRPAEHRALTAHPKLHAVDVGLAAWAARAGGDVEAGVFGALVETLVVNELVAQAGWMRSRPVVRHWRDTAQKLEVDAAILFEDGSSVAIEVKAAVDVRPDDLRGLRAYLASVRGAKRGVVFYTGGRVLELDPRIWAIPISALWTPQATRKP